MRDSSNSRIIKRGLPFLETLPSGGAEKMRRTNFSPASTCLKLIPGRSDIGPGKSVVESLGNCDLCYNTTYIQIFGYTFVNFEIDCF